MREQKRVGDGAGVSSSLWRVGGAPSSVFPYTHAHTCY